MERSEIRVVVAGILPDFIAFHPGYFAEIFPR